MNKGKLEIQLSCLRSTLNHDFKKNSFKGQSSKWGREVSEGAPIGHRTLSSFYFFFV